MIPEELLKRYDGCTRQYKPGEAIFNEKSQSYFQILSGRVKLHNLSERGREFIQDIIDAPQGFGVDLLFANAGYPVNAIALTNCSIIELSRDQFFLLLKRYPQYYEEIIRDLSDRLQYKMRMSHAASCKEPEVRLKALLGHLKSAGGTGAKDRLYKVSLTRQQMADLTGLTVETVIRTVKSMERRGLLRINDRKICY